MIEPENRLRWMGATKKDLRGAPSFIRKELGFAIQSVIDGNFPVSARQMRGDLRDVMEIRADDSSGTYRLMYTAKISDAIVVLHFFQKKSKSGIATSQHDLDVIRHRLKRARELYG